MTDLGLYVGSDTNLDTSDINLDTNSDTKRINNVIRGHSQTSKQLWFKSVFLIGFVINSFFFLDKWNKTTIFVDK